MENNVVEIVVEIEINIFRIVFSFQKFWGVVDYYSFYYVILYTTPRVR